MRYGVTYRPIYSRNVGIKATNSSWLIRCLSVPVKLPRPALPLLGRLLPAQDFRLAPWGFAPCPFHGHLVVTQSLRRPLLILRVTRIPYPTHTRTCITCRIPRTGARGFVQFTSRIVYRVRCTPPTKAGWQRSARFRGLLTACTVALGL